MGAGLTLGFIGTVVGVSIAIGGLNKVLETGDTKALLDGLRVAFDTTLIGLFASVTLSAGQYLIPRRAQRQLPRNGGGTGRCGG